MLPILVHCFALEIMDKEIDGYILNKRDTKVKTGLVISSPFISLDKNIVS